MKRCELLSPAGNRQMLEYAISYGADAVYLAGNKFGARKFATNFTNDELVDAINYAHLYGVKVYITINTLIYENEVAEFLDYVDFIYNAGVDAVLVQDFGMLNLIHELYPDLELHASTQMHNNSSDMLKMLESLGIKRAVMDREMSLEEIKTLPKSIEKEVFCHGALCISYSGQCLFSSMILNRSGNRGECAGMCRLPYAFSNDSILEKNPKYYLSLKDLCTLNFVDQMIDAGVNSLKIEGRMKSPEYVGYMTKMYRKQIDNYYGNKHEKISADEFKNIKLLFNRGFTDGFLMNVSSDDIVNLKSPNHIGIHLGTYEKFKDKIRIILDEDIHQGDAIRFKDDNLGMTINFLYDSKGNLINSAKKGEIVYVDNFLDIKLAGEVRKVSDVLLNEDINTLPLRKVSISGIITIKRDKKIKFVVSDGINCVTVKKIIPCEALNRPISADDVKKQMCKTGKTVYSFKNLKINLDSGLFVNIKDLNDIRREALEMLSFERVSVKRKGKENKNICKVFDNFCQAKSLCVKVTTNEQYEAVKNYATKVYVSDRLLYENLNKDERVIYQFPEKTSHFDINEYMISDYGSMVNKKNDDLIYVDYMLNVTNSYSVQYLRKMGISKICLSVELKKEQIYSLCQNISPSVLELFLYGKCELMKMKYLSDKKLKDAFLIDRKNERFGLKQENGLTYLMSNKPIDRKNELIDFMKMGINNYRVDFFDESAEECESIIKGIHKKIFKE